MTHRVQLGHRDGETPPSRHAAHFMFFRSRPEADQVAEMVELGPEGTTLLVGTSMAVGTVIVLRPEPTCVDGKGSNHFLSSLTLAEVKWCREAAGQKRFSHMIGVKFVRFAE